MLNTIVDQEELLLIGKMIAGDRKSLKYFFDKYYKELCNYANLYLHDEMLSEEVVQDIFVYFWEKRSQIEIHSSVKAYLFGASKYKTLNTLRSQKKWETLADYGMTKDYSSEENAAEQCLRDDEFRQLLADALCKLPEKCRQVFLLSKQRGLTNKQVADELGISVKTVEGQMTIALKKLRQSLRPHYSKLFALLVASVC